MAQYINTRLDAKEDVGTAIRLSSGKVTWEQRYVDDPIARHDPCDAREFLGILPLDLLTIEMLHQDI
jgi:hypothetical protein